MKHGRALILVVLSLALACARRPEVDRSLTSQSQDSRAQYLILHFTGGTWDHAVQVLTEGPVSSHYLVRDVPVKVYQLVDEDRRAYHAGVSSWKGTSNLNAASIGIEIQNPGNSAGADGTVFQPYSAAQIDAVVALVKDVVRRHGIKPDRILGHGEIAPQRKVDPGPLFPWKRLAEEGLIPWPQPEVVAERRRQFEGALPTAAWFQTKLAEHGYQVPSTGNLDPETQRVLAVFQMRYRPADHRGQPDAETAALLVALTDASPLPATSR